MSTSVSVVDKEHVDFGTDQRSAIHLNIPPRFYLVPGTAIIVGTAIGLMRGAQRVSLQFLAENVHRPPTTVQGWYFYNKTKNYKVMLGGLKGAGAEASKLGAVAIGWVGIEEGLGRVGLGDWGEIGAAVGTAGMFSVIYRLPWKSARRAVLLGVAMGGGLRTLRWARGQLEVLGENHSAE